MAPHTRMRLGERPKRLLEARARLAKNDKVGATVALLGNNSLNRIFNTAINKLSVNNFHRTNINALRELIRARMRNSTSSNNSVLKNATIKAMTNYVAQRIGYKNRANSEQLYRLIMVIMEKGRRMNAATNNAQRRIIGEEIGGLLGSLVLKWNEVRVKDPAKKGFAPGFMTGFLTPIIGANAARRIVGTMPFINSARAYFANVKQAMSNPGMSYSNRAKYLLNREKFLKEKEARQAGNKFYNAPVKFPNNQ